MSWIVIAVLIIVGLLFLILEILVVPGTTFVGVIGFILIAVGVWQTYASYGTPAGHYVLGATLLLTLVTIGVSLRPKTWNRVMLHSEIDSRANAIDQHKIKVGDVGITVSRLAPTGKIFINDNYYEANSAGDFIDQKTTVEVVKIEHNRIVVKIKN